MTFILNVFIQFGIHKDCTLLVFTAPLVGDYHSCMTLQVHEQWISEFIMTINAIYFSDKMIVLVIVAEALQNDSQQISSLPSSSSSLNAHTVDGSRNNFHSVKKMNIISRVQKIYADRQARLNALQIQSRQPDTVTEPSPSIPNQELTTIEGSRTSTGSTIVSREISRSRTNSDYEPYSIIRNTEPTRVIVSETSPETEFEPANKHHHFGILHYIVNNRFRKVMLVLFLNLLLFAIFFASIFLFFYLQNRNAKQSGTTISPNVREFCLPNEKSTLLFAYSNDLTADQVLKTWRNLSSNLSEKSYSTFALTRFDTAMYKNITWRTDFNGFNSSLSSNLPNETEAITDPKMGSNLFQVLNDFFNSKLEHCGATIFVLMKRLPSDTDISVLVSTLQTFHAQITIVISETPLGGLYQDSIYRLASETNGICLFAEDDRFQDTPAWLPSTWPLYLVYSFNAVVTKSGNVTLKNFDSPLFGDYHICMTLQDYGPLDSFRMVNLAWYNAKSSTSDSFGENVTSHARYGDTTYIRKGPYPLDAVPYHMTLGFEYSEDKSNILQIRIYSVKSVDVWFPYDYSAIDYWVAPAN
ncbi:hypothetical protein CRE_15637 [Caenorhabditis remanei]|uniref:DUF7154 domain-containing protein n=1 Tax=Caenorhabditis remanei TaxID=31234 RepID=E3N833_CAERE|nr:hypothetical protein CRE_15637 [Caenorhabditis remanei]